MSATIDIDNQNQEQKQGIIISSPTPIINDIKLFTQLETVVFSPSSNDKKALMPSKEKQANHSIQSSSFIDIPFKNQDILQEEQLCLVFTDKFACIIVKTDNDNQTNNFHFSFTPGIIKKAWYLLKVRLMMSHNPHHEYIDELVNRFQTNVNAPIHNRIWSYLKQLNSNIVKAPSNFLQGVRINDKVSYNPT